MNTEQIIALRDELMTRDTSRHAKYDLIMQAVGGDYQSRRMEGFWQNWQEFTGKPIPSDREAYEFKLNLLPSLISAQRSFIGTVPSLQCPPAGLGEPGDTTLKERAEKLERVYQGFWTYSHIGKRMNQIGYWNPTLGTSIGVVWPDVDAKRPTMQIRSPYGFYPVLADVDGQKLSKAIFHTKYKRHQVAAMYPSVAARLGDTDTEVNVDQYIDENVIKTIVGDLYEVKSIDNKWGFVPIVMIPNDAFGEGPWGDSALEWCIPVQEEHNYRESLKSAILEQTILQPLAVEGGELAPEEIGMGPRDVVPVQLGGRVYRVNPVQVPYQYLQAQSDLLKLFDRTGQIPEIMQGQSGSYQTGRAVSTLMGPTQMAFNAKGNEIYPAIAELNKMAMRMWHKMWGRNKHTVYSLGKGNSMSVETFKTGEFDGWYENIVYVDSASYFDAKSRFVMVLQAVQNRLMSRETAMQFVPGVTNPPDENKRINAELQADIDMQKANEARDQANVQPDMGAQGATNANLQQGFMGKTPAPEAIGGLEAAPEEAPENETQEGTLLQDMIEFFDEIPLRGKVWLAGGIVLDPAYSPQSPDYTGIEVYLSDNNDKAAINTTMRTQYPEVWGHITYHSGEPSPEEPSILVNDTEEPEEQGPEMPTQGPDMTDLAARGGPEMGGS